jgi:hypothetical protein
MRRSIKLVIHSSETGLKRSFDALYEKKHANSTR